MGDLVVEAGLLAFVSLMASAVLFGLLIGQIARRMVFLVGTGN